MVKPFLQGVTLFVSLVISNALMKLFGQPILDLIPSGTWGLEQAAIAVHWLSATEAAYWYVAVGVLAVFLLVTRTSLLPLLATVVVATCLALGIVLSVTYRLFHLDSIVTNVAADPAFWLLIAGVLAPIALWGIKLGFEAASWAIDRRRAEKARLVSMASTAEQAADQFEQSKRAAVTPAAT